MRIVTYPNQQYQAYTNDYRLNALIGQIGKTVQMPIPSRNYCIFNFPLVNEIVNYGSKAIPGISNVLMTANDENTVAESIYILDRMIDANVKGVEKAYPVLSRFNDTGSPTIQTLLAGIYRKTQVPDAFGPLCKMLIRNSVNPAFPQYFDPTEEIGGAILEYIKNAGAANLYLKKTGNI